MLVRSSYSSNDVVTALLLILNFYNDSAVAYVNIMLNFDRNYY